jgi:hypothetical protein
MKTTEQFDLYDVKNIKNIFLGLYKRNAELQYELDAMTRGSLQFPLGVSGLARSGKIPADIFNEMVIATKHAENATKMLMSVKNKLQKLEKTNYEKRPYRTG